jgi:hypothetical protein
VVGVITASHLRLLHLDLICDLQTAPSTASYISYMDLVNLNSRLAPAWASKVLRPLARTRCLSGWVSRRCCRPCLHAASRPHARSLFRCDSHRGCRHAATAVLTALPAVFITALSLTGLPVADAHAWYSAPLPSPASPHGAADARSDGRAWRF